MEPADLLTVIILGLIVATCWIFVPGLISGWLISETGRGFKWGFVLGAVLGPLGVIMALVLVTVTERRAFSPAIAGHRGHRRREHYQIPILGRVHVSTASTLAGLATFMCAWLLSGLTYEVFYNLPKPGERRSLVQRLAPSVISSESNSSEIPGVTATTATGNSRPSGARSEPPGAQGAASMMASASSQSTSSTASLAAPPQVSQQGTAGGGGSLEGVILTGVSPSPQPVAPPAKAQTQPASSATPISTPAPSGPSRSAIIAELTSTLGARGYKAHATVSGDAQTSTLSISCASLTRAAGNQLLGNSRTRQSLKSAGIRIVVMINGQESWTYML